LGMVALVLAASPVHAKSVRAQRYDSSIQILPDGTLRVTETVEFRLGGGPFTYVYRNLPLRRVDDIQIESSPDSFQVERSDRLVKVRWNFAPVHDVVRTFTFVYRVEGVLQTADGTARLVWNTFPLERQYGIEHATADLFWPAEWTVTQLVARPRRTIRSDLAANQAHFDAGKLNGETTLQLDAVFSGTGPATVAAPRWQARRMTWNANMPLMAGIAGGLLLLGVMITLALARDHGHRSERGTAAMEVTAPPSEISPALAGALRFGDAGVAQGIACFVDLASRGHVEFDTVRGKRWWTGGEYTIRRVKTSADLTAFERIVLDGAFRRGNGPGSGTVSAPHAWRDIFKTMRTFRAAVRDEMRKRGELDPDADATRTRLFTLVATSAAGALLSVALVPLLWDAAGPWLFLPSAALLLVVFTALIAAGSVSRLSPTGRQRSEAWKSFGKHLQELSKKDSTIDAKRFQSWFAYAVALGVAPAWLNAGKRLNLPAPAWFHVPMGENGAAGLAAMFAATGATSGAAAGGGGAAAGGGRSGAG